jgi:hypothetical protein
MHRDLSQKATQKNQISGKFKAFLTNLSVRGIAIALLVGSTRLGIEKYTRRRPVMLHRDYIRGLVLGLLTLASLPAAAPAQFLPAHLHASQSAFVHNNMTFNLNGSVMGNVANAHSFSNNAILNRALAQSFSSAASTAHFLNRHVASSSTFANATVNNALTAQTFRANAFVNQALAHVSLNNAVYRAMVPPVNFYSYGYNPASHAYFLSAAHSGPLGTFTNTNFSATPHFTNLNGPSVNYNPLTHSYVTTAASVSPYGLFYNVNLSAYPHTAYNNILNSTSPYANRNPYVLYNSYPSYNLNNYALSSPYSYATQFASYNPYTGYNPYAYSNNFAAYNPYAYSNNFAAYNPYAYYNPYASYNPYATYNSSFYNPNGFYNPSAYLYTTTPTLSNPYATPVGSYSPY